MCLFPYNCSVSVAGPAGEQGNVALPLEFSRKVNIEDFSSKGFRK